MTTGLALLAAVLFLAAAGQFTIALVVLVALIGWLTIPDLPRCRAYGHELRADERPSYLINQVDAHGNVWINRNAYFYWTPWRCRVCHRTTKEVN